MKNTTLKSKIAKGFSLVEMLVVIAVIGVIAAIAIPNIGNVNAAATKAKAQRNAQTIASVFQAGQAAGVAWGATDVPTAIAAVITGGEGTGAFLNTPFRAPNISTTEVGDLDDYLTYDNGLQYNAAGATTGGTTGG